LTALLLAVLVRIYSSTVNIGARLRCKPRRDPRCSR